MSTATWVIDHDLQYILSLLDRLKATLEASGRKLRVYVTITAARASANPAIVPDLQYAFREAKLKPWAVPSGAPGAPPMHASVLDNLKHELDPHGTDIVYATLCSPQEMASRTWRSMVPGAYPGWLNDSCVGPDSFTHFNTVIYDGKRI